MKKLTCLSFIALVLLAVACVKDAANKTPTTKKPVIFTHQPVGSTGNVTLTGTWKLVQTLSDPGDGSGTWQPAINSTTLLLNTDGTTRGTALPQYIKYSIKDSVTLTFKQADTTYENYMYQIRHDTLTMSPDGPWRCIEGCGIRFKKE